MRLEATDLTDFDELITRAANEERAAIESLVVAGPYALEAVLHAITARKPSFEPGLFEVIRRSDYPEAEPILRAHADAKSSGVVKSVLYSLARIGDPGLSFVVERLRATDELPTTRAFAAESLYGASAAGVADALRAVLKEQSEHPDDDPEWPLLLVNTATALATLGDHSGSAVLYRQFEAAEESARALAVKAFRVVVDGDSFHRLGPMLADDSPEARAAAVDPLFLLGTPAVAALLLERASSDRHEQVADTCVIRFGDILGLALSGVEDLEFARDEWRSVEDELDPNMCYRYGEPLTVANLAEDFAEEERLRDSLGAELLFITGVDVPGISRTDGPDAVAAALEGAEIEAGSLCKWGRPQPMPAMS
ncbi:MAG TPA: hypothetical protein VIP77_18785 [Jiangellaceae bacterium]